MKRPRVLLADDHILVLEGIRKLIEGEVDVVGAVEDGQAVLDAAHELRPDVIVLDISMPRVNGVEAARRLRKTLPSAKLIFLTMHGDPAYVAEALRLGASGYVLKSSASSELLEAIRQALKGRTYLTPLVKTPSARPRIRKRAEGSTGRQRKVR